MLNGLHIKAGKANVWSDFLMVIYRCSVVEGQENKVVVGCGWRVLESEGPQCLVQTGVKMQSLGD